MQIEDFAKVYQAKSDEELLELATAREQLTSEALLAFEGELSRRRIDSADNSEISQTRGDRRGASRLILRSLKFCGALVANLAFAVIGTTVLDSEVWRVIPSHTVAAILWKEIILSIVCATFIGFFMWRTWRTSAAKWIWIPAALWFVFRYLMIAGSTNVWGRLSGFSSGSVLSGPDVRTFFSFTVPLIRVAFYSVGAHISSLVFSRQNQPA